MHICWSAMIHPSIRSLNRRAAGIPPRVSSNILPSMVDSLNVAAASAVAFWELRLPGNVSGDAQQFDVEDQC